MLRQYLDVFLVAVAAFGISGCMDTSDPANAAEPRTEEAGVFFVSGDAENVSNCAFWNGAGQDAIMLSNDEGTRIIGPGGWTAVFESAQGGKTRIQIRDKDDKADTTLSTKMQVWLNGCP